MRLAAALIALVVAPAASAAVTVTTPATASFAVTLNGADQTPTFPLALTVATSGTSQTAGWSIGASVTQFTSGANTFPANAVSVTNGVDDASCAGGSCSNATNTVTWPVALSAVAAKIYNADINTGRGTNVITVTFQVAVPANVKAGSYTSTLTIQATVGP